MTSMQEFTLKATNSNVNIRALPPSTEAFSHWKLNPSLCPIKNILQKKGRKIKFTN